MTGLDLTSQYQPCSRLGHTCDYNPRLSFKDDTPRVIEKMSGGPGLGGPVWDRTFPVYLINWSIGSIATASSSRLLKRQGTDHPHEDLLPPFSSLTNDEAREKKAEFHSPGTYILVLNSSSFAEFDEYKESSKNSPSSRPESVHSDPYSNDRTHYNNIFTNENDTQTSDDPDIVILKVFEDDSRKLPSPSSATTRRPSSSFSVPSSATSAPRSDYFRFSYENTPLMRMAAKDGRDHQLVFYYKNFVHRHLSQVHRDSLGTSLETGALSAPDVFERQAANFPPVC